MSRLTKARLGVPVAKPGAPIPDKKVSQKRILRSLRAGAISSEAYLFNGGHLKNVVSF